MNRTILNLLMLFISASVFAQNGNEIICRLGFNYELSKADSWGKDLPVVKNITPYTQAATSGLKVNDIIIEIDGVSTSSITQAEIEDLFNLRGNNDVIVTVQNFNSPSKQILLKKECKQAKAISESDLASAFSFYSLESTNNQAFACPYKTIADYTTNLSNYHSFAFTTIDDANFELETAINNTIKKELLSKGLVYDPDQPDIIIQTFYYFDKNPNFSSVGSKNKNQKQYRFNPVTKSMEAFPFLPIESPESEAEYLLQYGFRLIDRKSSQTGQLKIIWECESNELLTKSMAISEYARTNTPLMLMQFPVIKYGRNPYYLAKSKAYNYTGLHYDINNLSEIVAVDKNSPAYNAGIRKGDVVEKINKTKMNHSAEEFSTAYKRFITETMPFRDPDTRFTDDNGFMRCMFWSEGFYPEIAKAFTKNEYLPAFSYLYKFAPYVDINGENNSNFVIKKGGSKQNIDITPEFRKQATVELK
ncbi:MAG: PDZ domain-containing protein [Tannerellaceae bacterium]